MEGRAAARSAFHFELAVMSFRDRFADGEAEAHATRFAGYEGLKQAGANIRVDARPVVGDSDGNEPVLSSAADEH